ncbi:MAG: ATP-dependent Clp protease ATP-binding subunit ClpX, partial [Candidatus Carbobacillus sp.]|nr:ATP-dependent Clp protease ATP-binding subunit ClpX [Candidatus Carbobacillus sp.]
IRRETGARGLRSILEEIMLDVMYEIPSREDVARCVVDEETVVNRLKPRLYSFDGRILNEKREESA